MKSKQTKTHGYRQQIGGCQKCGVGVREMD